MCLCVNRSWCSTVTVGEKLCTADIELLAVSLRHYYLPREFPQLFIILVDIDLRANRAKASEHFTAFCTNWNNTRCTLPNLYWVISTIVSRTSALKLSNNMLHAALARSRLCYGFVPDAFKALTLSPLSSVDHYTILLAPAYIPVSRRIKKTTKRIRQWTVESILSLQG